MSSTTAGSAITLLVGTRKGAFIYRGDSSRRSWRLEGPHYLGNVVNHIVQDPRDPSVLLMGARTGHLGPTVFRSRDGGATWQEARTPPAFPKVATGGRVVENVFWLTPGHASEKNTWWAGTV